MPKPSLPLLQVVKDTGACSGTASGDWGAAGPGCHLGQGGAAVVLLSPDLSFLLLEVQFLYYNQREDHQAVRAGRGAREEAVGGSIPGLH